MHAEVLVLQWSIGTRSKNARRPAKSRRIRLFERTKEKRSNKSKKNAGYTVSETCPGEHSMLNKRERSRECAGGAEEAAEHPAWGMHSVRGVQAVNADSGTGTANSQVCQLRRLGGYRGSSGTGHPPDPSGHTLAYYTCWGAADPQARACPVWDGVVHWCCNRCSLRRQCGVRRQGPGPTAAMHSASGALRGALSSAMLHALRASRAAFSTSAAALSTRPFHVQRTPLGFLPVYLETTSRVDRIIGKYVTIVRAVQGDVATFEGLLKDEFGNIAVSSTWRPESNTHDLQIQGNYREEFVDLLTRMGF